MPLIKVTTKKDGFRRGGREWHGTTIVDSKDFSRAQLKQIEEEPNLVVGSPSKEETEAFKQLGETGTETT